MTQYQPIKRLLIANRGEIAVRIIRTARLLGIHTIALYSDADARAMHVREADEAWHLGPAPARESYLDAAKVHTVDFTGEHFSVRGPSITPPVAISRTVMVNFTECTPPKV